MQAVQARAARTVAAVLAGRSLSAELATALDRPSVLVGGERGQLQDLCYGTLRFLGELRAIGDALVDRPITDALLQALIWVALYQLRHTRAAPYAVVDGAVNACPDIGSARARGLVNAVLRNALRRTAELDQVAVSTDVARHSCPPWWIDQLRSDLPDDWAAVLAAGNTHPPFTLRINPQRTSVDTFIAACAAQGIEALALDSLAACRLAGAGQGLDPDRAPDVDRAASSTDGIAIRLPLSHCVRLPRAQPVEGLPGFDLGWFSVQDAGAQLAAPLLAPRAGERVLDACAAPGGKTTHLLEQAAVELVALDSDAQRLQRVAANLGRLGQRATLKAADAAHVASWWDGRPFDRILLDAPCSGSGVVRRHPDIKWLRRATDLPRFAAQQRRLLASLWPLLVPGGRLLYCTCSVFRVENDRVVDAFLADQPGARRVSCDQHANAPVSGGQGDARMSVAGDLRLLPDSDHDGFHYALLTRH